MRLIDAEQFVTEMKINIGNVYNPDIIKGMKFAIELINIRPIAFDKEKVIEELENYLFEKYCVEGDSRIDEIVEKGGIE